MTGASSHLVADEPRLLGPVGLPDLGAQLRDDTGYLNYGNMSERSDSFAKRYREASDVGGLVR